MNSRSRKVFGLLFILLIIPLTIFVLQYTQIFKSRAATVPGSYGYSAFGENVYGTFTVATPSATLTPPVTITPGITITPIISSTSTPPVAATSIPVPTAPPGSTILSLNVFLHTIGNSGDNANPGNHSGSNKNPRNRTRTVSVEIRNTEDLAVASGSGSVVYDTATGSFKGRVGVVNLPVTGEYIVKVKDPTHLQRVIPGFHLLTKGQLNILPDATLVAGDANGDNKLNILDFNFLDDCYGNNANATCTPAKRLLVDFDDNGVVDLFDSNTLLRELGTQTGE